MDLNRAQEIVEAKEKIDVQVDGTSVWIEGIDAQSRTARVHTEGEPQDKRTVSIEDLEEIQ
ncbi:H-type small acid-soluble spore protein [Ammoniphilus sp. CFH 90114]|uniref:H-type small acid-soluble spore protein n=1 Tax=Ammoniphilus sp. CFH 90114 TaxID=2493665 RepID=UPI00100F5A8B|nr:H-type small acid-soluble spore protein [Ammoniphilus sp. CFH 90114]RXT13517.1 H-type small acid-soluble spore protein [Ammoniphilus sp. CFH 90114]